MSTRMLPVEGSIPALHRSLAEWLETWPAGRGRYEEVAADEGFEMALWSEASARL
ncbi:hypothetical protein [Streptomyces adustus]